MVQYGVNPRPKRKRALAAVVIFVAILAVGGLTAGIYARTWYKNNLKAASTSENAITYELASGMSAHEIAVSLENEGLVRNARAFEAYLRTQDLRDKLKAGTYSLTPSMTSQEIADVLVSGKEVSSTLTIGPGLRLAQIKTRFRTAGFSESDITDAFDVSNYASYPALVSKPEAADLEGYIFPETFSVTPSTKASSIVKQTLDELDAVLTPDLIKALNKKGLSVFEGLTLASIVEKEVSNPDDRKIVAQIFLKRLSLGMPLGSDATYFYASTITGEDPFPTLDSPYNTRMYAGLPPGPINNVSKTAIEAIAYPSDTDYLFFVTGDDGVNYYTRTSDEHDAAVKQHCIITCAPGYLPPDN